MRNGYVLYRTYGWLCFVHLSVRYRTSMIRGFYMGISCLPPYTPPWGVAISTERFTNAEFTYPAWR
jgi:hypothetical protein